MIFYPEPKDVFESDVETHSQYILPLATFNLSEINSSWNGVVHLINPVEPYDGLLGEYTNNSHTYYCRENWIAFDVIDNKYRLKTTFNFFQKKSIEVNNTEHFTYNGKVLDIKEFLSDLGAHYDKINNQYISNKLAFTENRISPKKLMKYSRLGGKPTDANWAHCTDFPLITVIQEKKQLHYPLTEDKRKFEFIGYFDSGNLGGPCCGICMFYDSIKNIVLFTFDW